MATTAADGARQAPGWGARPAAWAEQEGQHLPTYAAALRRVGLRRGSAVLDVGCGSGVFLGLAREHGARAFGLDAAPELLELARKRVPEADLRVGDLQVLPYEADGFDVVTGFNAFFYAADIVGALREAGRVAKPGAPVVMQVWGRPERCSLTAIKDAVRPLGPPAPRGSAPPLPLWPPGVLEGFARAAGLTPRDAFDESYAFTYPDDETLVRRLLARAPVVAAVEVSGEERVREALLRALEPLRGPDGAYRLENEWHFCVATA
jgi:SAM-dependent methyltransferase